MVETATPLAVAFLKKFYPKGPWLLTSIAPDKKGIETRTFQSSNAKAMEKWIDGWNGKRNMYFSVNPPTRDLTKKAERTDIASLCYLHVDVDPRAGEDLASEQERARLLCTEKLPEGVPDATFVIYSGGGYQAFWKLEQPIEINGDLETAEDLKLYNIQLERLFGADNCHNIDRIMRLPGTVNIPDEKKRKKGRVEVLATLVEENPKNVYPISTFLKAQMVQTSAYSMEQGVSPVQVNINTNIERLNSIEDLDEWDVPDRIKVIIVQGHDIDEPKAGDNSRSAWLFDVCCNLVRSGVPDDVIFAVITDPDFRISESVIEKRANAEKYALRNIAKAKEHAIDPSLVELNEKHAVIENFGGKCLVIEELPDEMLGRTKLTKMSFEVVRNRYLNRVVWVTKKRLMVRKHRFL